MINVTLDKLGIQMRLTQINRFVYLYQPRFPSLTRTFTKRYGKVKPAPTPWRTAKMAEIPTSSALSSNTSPSNQLEQKPTKQAQSTSSGDEERFPKHPTSGGGNGAGRSLKLRGFASDTPQVRLSKTISWILRHSASSEGVSMREDGFVQVSDILENSRIQPLGLSLEQLKEVVKADLKQRFTLIYELKDGTSTLYSNVEGEGDGQGVWLIKANQGHSMRSVKIEMKPIFSVDDIPSRMAVHGTTYKAWDIIQKEGLSRMKRNHIHLAQGVGGDNIISGMRKSSQVLIFIKVQKALDTGIKFQLSENGVVLTEGDERGYLSLDFIDRVEDAKTRQAMQGWEGSGHVDDDCFATKAAV